MGHRRIARELGARSRRAAVAASLVAAFAAACEGGGTRDIRATILDADGEPVPGALFYAEAYDDEGAFAFLVDRAGQAGEVPDSARRPLQIAWRASARIAIAAFAPDRPPAVLRDPGRRIETDGVLVVFDEAAPAVPLADLAFPFPPGTVLHAEAERPQYAALRSAFLEAIRAQVGERGTETPREREKIAALADMP